MNSSSRNSSSSGGGSSSSSIITGPGQVNKNNSNLFPPVLTSASCKALKLMVLF